MKFTNEELGFFILEICEKLPWLSLCIKSIRGYDQPLIIDYTLQVKENFLSKDLQINKKISTKK